MLKLFHFVSNLKPQISPKFIRSTYSQSKLAMDLTLSNTKLPKFKLTYFDLRAVGEPIRLMFVVAKVPFEDEKIRHDIWCEIKPHTQIGFGQMPVLYADGKQLLTQSLAIGRYLGKLFNLIPEDALLAAKCDEIVDFLTELRLEFREYINEQNVDKKNELKLNFINIIAPKYYQILSELISQTRSNTNKTGGAFICGDKLSWVDLFLANWIEIFEEVILGMEFVNNYPILKQLRQEVFIIPSIANYVKTRPKTVL